MYYLVFLWMLSVEPKGGHVAWKAHWFHILSPRPAPWRGYSSFNTKGLNLARQDITLPREINGKENYFSCKTDTLSLEFLDVRSKCHFYCHWLCFCSRGRSMLFSTSFCKTKFLLLQGSSFVRLSVIHCHIGENCFTEWSTLVFVCHDSLLLIFFFYNCYINRRNA